MKQNLVAGRVEGTGSLLLEAADLVFSRHAFGEVFKGFYPNAESAVESRSA